jgi:hypothetical protein
MIHHNPNCGFVCGRDFCILHPLGHQTYYCMPGSKLPGIADHTVITIFAILSLPVETLGRSKYLLSSATALFGCCGLAKSLIAADRKPRRSGDAGDCWRSTDFASPGSLLITVAPLVDVGCSLVSVFWSPCQDTCDLNPTTDLSSWTLCGLELTSQPSSL